MMDSMEGNVGGGGGGGGDEDVPPPHHTGTIATLQISVEEIAITSTDLAGLIERCAITALVIAAKLPGKDLLSLTCTCRAWDRLIRAWDRILFEPLIRHGYPSEAVMLIDVVQRHGWDEQQLSSYRKMYLAFQSCYKLEREHTFMGKFTRLFGDGRRVLDMSADRVRVTDCPLLENGSTMNRDALVFYARIGNRYHEMEWFDAANSYPDPHGKHCCLRLKSRDRFGVSLDELVEGCPERRE